jgi:hypothetical protein
MRLRQVLSFSFITGLALSQAFSQELITPGENKDGTLQAGTTNTLAFAAAVGDRMTLTVAKLTGGAGFSPTIEVFGPDGTRVGHRTGAVAARLDLISIVPGTNLVVISDFSGTGSGTYRVQLAQLPGTLIIPQNDEGGELTNGALHTGVVDVGDLDPWTIPCAAGDRLLVQINEANSAPGFTPLIELFGPDGTLLSFNSGPQTARLDIQARVSGPHVIMVSDTNPAGSGT